MRRDGPRNRHLLISASYFSIFQMFCRTAKMLAADSDCSHLILHVFGRTLSSHPQSRSNVYGADLICPPKCVSVEHVASFQYFHLCVQYEIFRLAQRNELLPRQQCSVVANFRFHPPPPSTLSPHFLRSMKVGGACPFVGTGGMLVVVGPDIQFRHKFMMASAFKRWHSKNITFSFRAETVHGDS